MEVIIVLRPSAGRPLLTPFLLASAARPRTNIKLVDQNSARSYYQALCLLGSRQETSLLPWNWSVQSSTHYGSLVLLAQWLSIAGTVNQLYSLETTLLRVKQLELEEEQRSEYIALRQSASQCQQTINSFWKKIQKYQRHLKAGGFYFQIERWLDESQVGDVPTRGPRSVSNRLGCTYAAYQHHYGSSASGGWMLHMSRRYCWLQNLRQNSLKNQDRKRNAEYKSMIAATQDATFQCMAKLVKMTASIASYVCLCSPTVLI